MVAAVVTSSTPAHAACTAARAITSATSTANASYLFSPGNPFLPAADTDCYTDPQGGQQHLCGGSVTYFVNGFFWAFGAGNPAAGLGADSGTNKGGYGSNWLQTSYYPYFASIGGSSSHWQYPGTDGCITETGNSSGATGLPDSQECLVLVLEDMNGPTGSFLAMSAPPNQAFDFEFTPATGFPAELNLVPTPKPVITSAFISGDACNLVVSLPLGALTRANGFDFKCHGAPGEILTGWKLYYRAYPFSFPEPQSAVSRALVPPPGFPPTPPWIGLGGRSPIGTPKVVQFPKGSYQVLCATLTFGGPSNAAGATDWELKYCGASSSPILCDNILAEPGAKKPPKQNRKSTTAPHGRDQNPPKDR